MGRVAGWGRMPVKIIRNTGKCRIEKKKRKKKEKTKEIFFHIKYTHKEQRRRILPMSFKKLTKIQNPESILNKSVLINNMLRSIQNQILVEASEVKDKAVPVAVKDKLVGYVVT